MATLSTPLTTQESPLSRLARWLAGLSALLVITASSAGMALGVVELMYADRVYPGVTVYGINLSGLSRDQAVELLSRNFTYPQTGTFVFRDGDQTWTAAPAQLGATFDVQETAERAFAYGRSGDWRLDLEDQFWAWYEGTDIAPVIVFDRQGGGTFLQAISTQIDTPAVEAALIINGTDVIVTP